MLLKKPFTNRSCGALCPHGNMFSSPNASSILAISQHKKNNVVLNQNFYTYEKKN